MAWITLTAEHIKSRLAVDELDAVEDTGNEGDATPRLPGIIEQVTLLVRGKVAACKDNTLDADATKIPEELLWAAATIAKHDIRASLPTTGSEEETRLRQREIDQAFRQLDDAAACRLSITNPDGAVSGQLGGCYGGANLLDF